jgi:hypothetical protein
LAGLQAKTIRPAGCFGLLATLFWVAASLWLPTIARTGSARVVANTLRVGAGMGLRLWRGADLFVDYELGVAKPSGEPDSRIIRFTIRQLW